MPSTDGRASSSSAPSDLHLVGNSVNDVHHDGADQSAKQGIVEQFHSKHPILQSRVSDTYIGNNVGTDSFVKKIDEHLPFQVLVFHLTHYYSKCYLWKKI